MPGLVFYCFTLGSDFYFYELVYLVPLLKLLPLSTQGIAEVG